MPEEIFGAALAGANLTAAQSVQSQNLFDLRISGNTAGATALVSSGTLTLYGGTNITLSQAGNAITINAPPSVTDGTVSLFGPVIFGASTFTQIGQSSLKIYPMVLPNYGSFSVADFYGTVAMTTNATQTHAGTLSVILGIYTLAAASTIGLYTSGSVSYAWSDSAGASSSVITGERRFSVPMNFTGTPGNYWVAMISKTASAGFNNVAISNIGVLVTPNQCNKFLVATNATHQFMPGLGNYSVQTAAFPATINIDGDIIGSDNKTIAPYWVFRNLQ